MIMGAVGMEAGPVCAGVKSLCSWRMLRSGPPFVNSAWGAKAFMKPSVNLITPMPLLASFAHLDVKGRKRRGQSRLAGVAC